MLDQSYSPQNFKRILDLATRKGVHVEDKLSMFSIRNINDKIRKCNKAIVEKKKAGDMVAVKTLYEEKKSLREEKESKLTVELENISRKITLNSFRVEFKNINIPGKGTVFTTSNKPEHYFALLQTQRNIFKLFGVKQSNRYAIVEQVISLLKNKFPKYIIRTDLENFYENIPHEPLIERIYQDNLLSPLTRKIITGILDFYKSISGFPKGVPRGIGVSPYLTELYMRDIDNNIKELDGVTYYARYVDDMIIIFTPTIHEISREYLNELVDIVENKYKLKINTNKTQVCDLLAPGTSDSFEYLGYKMYFGDGFVNTKLTQSKVDKYKNRIDLSIKHYLNYSKINEKHARNILVKRIRFLTGNTRLVNNKRNILVGIYYSNSHLTDLEQLNFLDKHLNSQIEAYIGSDSLKRRLLKYSFVVGYEEKRFSPFKANELSEIVEIW